MYIDIRAGSSIYDTGVVPVEAMSDSQIDSRAIAQPSRECMAAAVQRVSMMKRAAVVDYGIDYG